MRVRITEKDLPRGACSHGKHTLRRKFPDGIRVENWTWQHGLWASATFKYYPYLMEKGLIPVLNAKWQDLRNVKLNALRGVEAADFTGAQVLPGQKLPRGWVEENGRMRRARD